MNTAATEPPDDRFAPALRGFGPVGLAAIVLIVAGNWLFVPLSALLVLAWAGRSHTPWSELGFTRPRSWFATVAFGLVFGILLKLVMKAVVMPLLGAPAINQPFHYLVGNTAALPGILYAVVIGAGFGEEIFFRAYLFERFGRLFGSSVIARTAIVLLSAGVFGWAHYAFQGIPGVQQATIVGLIFGAIFAVTRQIWLLMIAHTAFDLTAVAIIYWDLESRVAHLLF